MGPEVRKDKLPADLEEHLRGMEEFFDHYAGSVENWLPSNGGDRGHEDDSYGNQHEM